MKKPTANQIQLRRLALSMTGIAVNNAVAETILIVESECERLGGKFSLKDAAANEGYIEKKYVSAPTSNKKK